jgi:hypothetical protein
MAISISLGRDAQIYSGTKMYVEHLYQFTDEGNNDNLLKVVKNGVMGWSGKKLRHPPIPVSSPTTVLRGLLPA